METFLIALYKYLVQSSPQVIERVYAPTNFATGALIPTNPNGETLSFAATQYDVFNADAKGETDAVDEQSDEFPEVEVTIGRDSYKTIQIPAAFSYKEGDLQAAELAASNGQPIANELIRSRPTDAALEIITRRANVYAAYGKGSTKGLLNNTLVPTELSTFDPYATATTDQQLMDWLVEWNLEILDRNNLEDDELHVPDTLLLPGSMRRRMRRTVVQNNPSDNTLETKFLMSQTNIKKIHYSNLLGGAALEKYQAQAPGTARDRLMFYRRDPKFVSRVVSPVHVYRPSYHKAKYWSGFAQRFTETVIHQPNFAQIVTFSNTNA